MELIWYDHMFKVQYNVQLCCQMGKKLEVGEAQIPQFAAGQGDSIGCTAKHNTHRIFVG